MKRFKDLTENQKQAAVGFALAELKECVEMGIIDFGKPVNESLLRDYAVTAAEDAHYVEDGDKVIFDLTQE